jgi:hypothetical protein
MRRRSLAVAVVAGALASAAVAIPAHAAYTASCSVSGTADVTPTNPQAFVQLNAGGIPFVAGGQAGTYSFDPAKALRSTLLHLTCNVTDGTTTASVPGGAPVPSFDVEQVDVASSGNFTNWVCGTAEAYDHAAVVVAAARVNDPASTPPAPIGNKDLHAFWPPNIGYDIKIAAGQGTLVFDPPIFGGGEVSITPTQRGFSDANPLLNQCTDEFSVSGAVTGELGPIP